MPLGAGGGGAPLWLPRVWLPGPRREGQAVQEAMLAGRRAQRATQDQACKENAVATGGDFFKETE